MRAPWLFVVHRDIEMLLNDPSRGQADGSIDREDEPPRDHLFDTL